MVAKLFEAVTKMAGQVLGVETVDVASSRSASSTLRSRSGPGSGGASPDAGCSVPVGALGRPRARAARDSRPNVEVR